MQERNAIKRLLNSPRFAINHTLAKNLKDVGLSFEFHDLSRIALASQCRAAMASSTLLEGIKDMQEIQENDSNCIASLGANRRPDWYKHSIASTLINAYNYFFSLPPDIVLYHPGGRRNELQKLIHKHLRSSACSGAAHILHSRANRWIYGATEANIEGIRVRIKGACSKLGLWAPGVSVIKFICRAIRTGHRFQQKNAECIFNCNAGIERIEHFAICQVLLECFNEVRNHMSGFPRIVENRLDIHDLLLFGCASGVTDDMARMCVVDAIAHAHAACRNESGSTRQAGFIKGCIVARIKFYRTVSGSLDRACREFTPSSNLIFIPLPSAQEGCTDTPSQPVQDTESAQNRITQRPRGDDTGSAQSCITTCPPRQK